MATQNFELLKKSAVTQIAQDLANQTQAQLNQWALDRSFTEIGDFTAGFTITARQQIALFNGEWYRWDGALPKVVAPGSTPIGTGGIAQGAWLSVGDAAIRNALDDPNSTVSVGGVEAGKIAKRVDYYEIKADLGGIGDGVSDDSAALASDVPEYIVTRGTYRVPAGTTITITADTNFLGGIIHAELGATVLFEGAITAPLKQIFSGEGTFGVTSGTRTAELNCEWFGIVFDDQTGLIPENNMKAIRKTLDMAGYLGIPDGVYNTPAVKLPRGFVFLDDDDNDGIGAIVHSYTDLRGWGDISVLRPKDGAKAFDVLVWNENHASQIHMDAFQIYGEWSVQTNTQHAIVINPPSGTIIYSSIGNRVFVKEMRGNAIRCIGAGVENCDIKPRIVRDCLNHNIYVSRSRDTVWDTKSRSAKSGFWGAVFESANVIRNTILGDYDQNNAGGLFLSNTGQRNRIGVSCSNNFAGPGAFLDRADNTEILYFTGEANFGNGLATDKCDGLNGGNIVCRANQHNGMSNYDLKSANLNGVRCSLNGLAAANTYANFELQGDSDNNQINGLQCRAGSETNRVKYNLLIGSNQCTNNSFGEIDLRNGEGLAPQTAAYLDLGINTLGIIRTGTSTQAPSVAAGATAAFDIAVSGTLTTDKVKNARFSLPLSGLIMTAWVQSANTVRVQFYNPTSSTITLASGTITVETLRENIPG